MVPYIPIPIRPALVMRLAFVSEMLEPSCAHEPPLGRRHTWMVTVAPVPSATSAMLSPALRSWLMVVSAVAASLMTRLTTSVSVPESCV